MDTQISSEISWLDSSNEESNYFGIIDLHTNHWMRNESKIALRVNKIYDILNTQLINNLKSDNNITFEKFKHRIFISLYEMKENQIINSFSFDINSSYNRKFSFKVNIGFFGELKGKLTIMDISGININQNMEYPDYYALEF